MVRYIANRLLGLLPTLLLVGFLVFLFVHLLPGDPARLAAWILDPQSIKPGTHMPATQIDGEDLGALTTYLASLR